MDRIREVLPMKRISEVVWHMVRKQFSNEIWTRLTPAHQRIAERVCRNASYLEAAAAVNRRSYR